MIKLCTKCLKEFETHSNRKFLCDTCQLENSKKESICVKCGNVRHIRKYQKDTSLCIKCVNVGRKHSEETNIKNSERNKGKGNGFYGKKHSDESKLKCGQYERTEEQKQQASQSIKLVTNTRPVFDIWEEKFGTDVANQKEQSRRTKISKKVSGENNPMYGKPSPTGSGNGWSGWYKEQYFRSILELSYLKYLYDNNIRFESGEQKKYSIPYIIDGVKRNYFCDYFLIDSDMFVEIKPKALLNSKDNLLKFETAKKVLCDRFIIKTEDDLKKLTDIEILDMYNNQEIKWLDRYQKKFEERYLNVTTHSN
jgi:hypothetical protein